MLTDTAKLGRNTEGPMPVRNKADGGAKGWSGALISLWCDGSSKATAGSQESQVQAQHKEECKKVSSLALVAREAKTV
jgi:hypothetical protein